MTFEEKERFQNDVATQLNLEQQETKSRKNYYYKEKREKNIQTEEERRNKLTQEKKDEEKKLEMKRMNNPNKKNFSSVSYDLVTLDYDGSSSAKESQYKEEVILVSYYGVKSLVEICSIELGFEPIIYTSSRIGSIQLRVILSENFQQGQNLRRTFELFNGIRN